MVHISEIKLKRSKRFKNVDHLKDSSSNSNDLKTVSEVLEKINNDSKPPKFVKKEHRPWDDLTESSSPPLTNIKKESTTIKVIDLFGCQKTILEYLIDNVVDKSVDNYLTTPVTKTKISSDLGISVNTVNSSLTDLKSKSYISAFKHKPGRGGYSIFSIARDVFEAFTGADSKQP